MFKVYKTFSFPLSSQNKQTEQKPLDRRSGKIGLRRPAGNNAIVGKKGLKKPKGVPGAEGPPNQIKQN